MIVYVGGDSENMKVDMPYYQAIVEVIHDNDAVISRDWIGVARSRVEKNITRDTTKAEWADMYKENIEGMIRADIVIMEATNYRFPEGFYISEALRLKKPVLLVTRENVRNRVLYGIKHKLLSIHHYDNVEDLKKIVNKFIKANTIATKDLRFNFFIDRQIYTYLREVSYETGKNKSEIIRELLEKEIDKQDNA
jgi:hypothetical protein